MKVLLADEGLEFLAERMSGFNVLTSRKMGLSEKGVSTVMREARDMKFDAVVTANREFRFAAGTQGWTFGIVLLEISPADEESYLGQLDRIKSGVLGANPGVISSVRWPR
ncbi:MAG: hypothetical protein ACKVQS_12170 [Fimbriimonadaceae bacterium]